MHRYQFVSKDWKPAIDYIKNGNKTVLTPNWAVRFKDDLKIKRKTQIFYQDKKIIPSEQVEKFLRKKLYDKKADIAFGRDSAFYSLSKECVGVGRRKIMDFLRAQKSRNQTLGAVAEPKVKSGKKLKDDGIHCETDLIFVKTNDVNRMNSKVAKLMDKSLNYISCTVHKATGLVRAKLVQAPADWKNHEDIKLKGSTLVTKIVKQQLQEIATALGSNLKKVHLTLDAGTEYNRKALKKVLKSVTVVPMGPNVEAKNARVQTALFRILKNRQCDNIAEGVRKAQDQLNNCYSKIQKKSPNEAASDPKEARKKYNSTRKSYVQGDNRGELNVGDHVRLLIKKPKAGIGYKTYKNQTWSQEVYTILSKTKKQPAKYRLSNKKYYTIDKLMKSKPVDKESEKIIKDRKADDDKEEEKSDLQRLEEKAKHDIKIDKKSAEGGRSIRRRGNKPLQARLRQVKLNKLLRKRQKELNPDTDSDPDYE